MKTDDLQSHIKLSQELLSQHGVDRALVCGDPARAEMISTFLDQPQLLAKNREYHSYVGGHQGKKILVMSHGVGSAGAAIGFHELFESGIKTVIRIGTAGGLQEKSKVAGIVVATAAVRKDGVSSQMVPVGYPAVADLHLTLSLNQRANSELKSGAIPALDLGIILSTDLFYPGLLDDELKLFSRAGVKAVEMEASTLFVMASLRGLRAGTLVVLDGNPLFWDQGVYAPGSDVVKKSTKIAIQVALDVLASDPH